MVWKIFLPEVSQFLLQQHEVSFWFQPIPSHVTPSPDPYPCPPCLSVPWVGRFVCLCLQWLLQDSKGFPRKSSDELRSERVFLSLLPVDYLSPSRDLPGFRSRNTCQKRWRRKNGEEEKKKGIQVVMWMTKILRKTREQRRSQRKTWWGWKEGPSRDGQRKKFFLTFRWRTLIFLSLISMWSLSSCSSWVNLFRSWVVDMAAWVFFSINLFFSSSRCLNSSTWRSSRETVVVQEGNRSI